MGTGPNVAPQYLRVAVMPDYEILARTPFPGPDAPTGNVQRVAITFRLAGDVSSHTVWIPADIADEANIARVIELWIEKHPQS